MLHLKIKKMLLIPPENNPNKYGAEVNNRNRVKGEFRELHLRFFKSMALHNFVIRLEQLARLTMLLWGKTEREFESRWELFL